MDGFSEALNRKIAEHISPMIPDWGFDVRTGGTFGTATLIRIRLWKAGHEAEIEVNPSHYMNHPDSLARANPAIAAVVDGIKGFKKDLETNKGLRR